jgi:hypothetical protein
MEEQKYPFSLVQRELRYEFWSRSEEKEIKKIVIFTKVGYVEDNFYNLALMDELANDFLMKNPDAIVAFKGSDYRRHRLYRIALNREKERLSEKFIIAGYTDGEVYPFEINGEYEQFLIKIK